MTAALNTVAYIKSMTAALSTTMSVSVMPATASLAPLLDAFLLLVELVELLPADECMHVNQSHMYNVTMYGHKQTCELLKRCVHCEPLLSTNAS